MPNMQSICYVSLELGVVADQLGGKTHIEGVLEAMQDSFNVTLATVDAGLVSGRFQPINMPSSRHQFYFKLFKMMWSDRYAVFLMRKTIGGLWAVNIFNTFISLFGRRKKVIFEFNGISGDFRFDSGIPRLVLTWLNLAPLSLGGGVYAVNENIAKRVLSNCFSKSCRVVVGENGCFSKIGNFKRQAKDEAEGVTFFFFGADQAKYHLTWFLDAFCRFDPAMTKRVLLIGRGLEKYEHYPYVEAVGHLTLREFVEFVQQERTRNSWGVVPLDRLPSGSDVVPIKSMDYLSAGLPIIHSDTCLGAFEDSPSFLSYRNGDVESIESVFSSCILDESERSEIDRDIARLVHENSWTVKLKPVRDLICELC